MNKDEKKRLDDRFKKNIIDDLPEFIPDENKKDIAEICSDVVDFLDGKKTNNTIVALDILKKYYTGSILKNINVELMASIVKDLEELDGMLKGESGTIH